MVDGHGELLVVKEYNNLNWRFLRLSHYLKKTVAVTKLDFALNGQLYQNTAILFGCVFCDYFNNYFNKEIFLISCICIAH